jgi:hypothetical protein
MANLALKAAYGEDTMDLLNHLAWTDIVKPRLEEARKTFTDQLVSVTLRPQAEGSETKEQIAGKLYGIMYITTIFEKILKEGANAREVLARENLFLQ